MRHMKSFFLVAACLVLPCFVSAQTVAQTQTMGRLEESSSQETQHARASLQAAEAQSEMDHDLFEVTIPQLENFYATHKYTVTQVVQWHLARIAKYNGIYRAVQTLDARGALA